MSKLDDFQGAVSWLEQCANREYVDSDIVEDFRQQLVRLNEIVDEMEEEALPMQAWFVKGNGKLWSFFMGKTIPTAEQICCNDFDSIMVQYDLSDIPTTIISTPLRVQAWLRKRGKPSI